jgi:Holliday junction resolvasome RuvABC DNA-binding subunit
MNTFGLARSLQTNVIVSRINELIVRTEMQIQVPDKSNTVVYNFKTERFESTKIRRNIPKQMQLVGITYVRRSSTLGFGFNSYVNPNS